MSETNKHESGPLQPDDVKTSGVKSERNPKGAGRKPKSYYTRAVQDILDGSASRAAQILDDHIAGKRGRKTLKASLQRACEYVIDHAIGKSRQKVEHTGGVMTYKQLVDSAQNLETSGRDILADVEELAQKYNEKQAEK